MRETPILSGGLLGMVVWGGDYDGILCEWPSLFMSRRVERWRCDRFQLMGDVMSGVLFIVAELFLIIEGWSCEGSCCYSVVWSYHCLDRGIIVCLPPFSLQEAFVVTP